MCGREYFFSKNALHATVNLITHTHCDCVRRLFTTRNIQIYIYIDFFFFFLWLFKKWKQLVTTIRVIMVFLDLPYTDNIHGNSKSNKHL